MEIPREEVLITNQNQRVVTAATANRLVAELEKVGILQEKTVYARNRLYALHEYLEIFRQ